MSYSQPPRPPTRRSPLGDASGRTNMQHPHSISMGDILKISHETPNQDCLPQGSGAIPGSSSVSRGTEYPPRESHRGESPNSSAANPRLSSISKDHAETESNRNSQISTVSTNASDGKRIKSCIGPWKLGKTLGKGATARVRLARHIYTGQEAAIKIVQKKHAQMSQAGSLAALDQVESTLAESEDGMRRMPIGIEREVAIMKLIQHPNIMKLYDIWENRTEIYLVLEYVDNGELFEHITVNGRLEEEEAMKYFRQILSAVGYCHAFNICHRDLKPENILLTKGGDIKIADFGMAALHQTPDHKLKTSCGSPHYAAPELIRGSTYRGDKVDIWSMGVILYATLAGRLPFDVEGSGKDWIAPLLLKIRKGTYEMAPEFSHDAANLIWRILQVNPRDRISLCQIWRHPAVRKYDYLDEFGGGMNPATTMKNCGHPVIHRSDISKELLRHLRSLWHRLSEEQLMDALLSEEANDQKLFYGLFLKYRDAQLENYIPDIEYSTSDYHHVRPVPLTKAYSTRQFPQPKLRGHGRQISRFTVISNVAETEQSYDPFKASRFQHLDAIRGTDRAKITIHRTGPSSAGHEQTLGTQNGSRQFSRASVSVASGSERGRYQKLAPPPAFTSRSSLASSTRSRNSGRHVRAPIRYKRGVSFVHIRNRSGGNHAYASGPSAGARHSSYIGGHDDSADLLQSKGGSPGSTRYIRSRKGHSAVSQPLLSIGRPDRASQLWTDDVRQLSSSLAKDCDEAFNRYSVVSDTDSQGRNSNNLACFEPSYLDGQPTTPTQSRRTSTCQNVKHNALNNRPLPPPPIRSDSVKKELIEARMQAELRKSTGGDVSPGYLDRMVSHIDRLIEPMSPVAGYTDCRASSAPVDGFRTSSLRPLPSIYEARKEDDSPRRQSDYDKYKDQCHRNETKAGRIASAPEPRHLSRQNDDQFPRPPKPRMRDTIRVVNSPILEGPVQMPAPLTIRKKSSQGGRLPPPDMARTEPDRGGKSTKHRNSGLELRQQYSAESKPDSVPDHGHINEGDDKQANDSNSGTIVKKKSTWFKRSSKSGGENDWTMSIGGGHGIQSLSSGDDTAQVQPEPLPFLPKKKGFSLGRLFKRRPSNTDMSLAGNDILDDSDEDSDEDYPPQSHHRRRAKYEDLASRQIEPQRSWIAKLFNVKPATGFICFCVSKRRARREIVKILRDWKRYGIKGVQVDKDRSIVFGRVATKNFLNMKEVAFAGEIMTVIEHGKRSRLAIARFTQERGAASSFHKVVETLETVLRSRGMLVIDERKRRRMVKTLDSA